MKNIIKKVLLLVVTVFIIFVIFKPRYVPIPILQTAGIKADAYFQFTLSPDNQWLVYFEHKYPYKAEYDLVVFNTLSNKKFIINTEQVLNFTGWMQNACWTADSKYCVMSEEGSYQAIDFTDPMNPTFKKDPVQYSDKLTCSDCLNNRDYKDKLKDFNDLSPTTERTSPDQRFKAQIVDKENGFIFLKGSNINLYILDTKKGTKTFVDRNIYFDIHFSSDSSRLYYYACPIAGACNNLDNNLYYINLFKKENLIQKLIP